MIRSATTTETSHKAALFTIFACCGIIFSSWATRTPQIQEALNADTGFMGLIFLGLSGGSFVGLLAAGPLVGRHGTRTVLLWASLSMGAGLVMVGGGALLQNPALVIAGLAAVGGGFGSCEVALNVDGTAMERTTQRSLLPALHGTWSLGSLAGAGIGAGAVAFGIPVSVHLGSLGILLATACLVAIKYIPGGSGIEPKHTPRTSRGAVLERLRIFREPRTLLVSLFVFGMAFAEGTANDWLTLAIIDGYHTDPSTASAGFAVFVACMTAGRLAGGYFVNRFGRTGMLRISAAMAVVGVLLVVVAAGPAIGLIGIILWGLGSALGFPVGLSAAGDNPHGAAARVSAVATVGYAAFLIGPPFLGMLGQSIGLLPTLLVAMGCALMAVLLAGATRPPSVVAAGQPSELTDEGSEKFTGQASQVGHPG
ncbi:MFS transporter [Paenarthrobacter sp. NPDC092416]|uniref:MFS transporter n=1 Tax=Paenarthrobacter sp. NPDC092416 TaxID=3364386 RepID=UPI003803615A